MLIYIDINKNESPVFWQKTRGFSVYCPWDVISHCDILSADPAAEPQDYWSNTSSNSIVRRFIDKSGKKTKDEIEQLIAGEEIVKEIRPELT